MLVLSRKQSQAILVDGPATIRVLEVSGRVVRIGIEAPQSTHIEREERVVDQNNDTCRSTDEGDLCG